MNPAFTIVAEGPLMGWSGRSVSLNDAILERRACLAVPLED
jgi:hypothetical protein